MIIVKTKNGETFINEKEITMVCHDKAGKQVSFHQRDTMQGVKIFDVESVKYVTDDQPFEFNSEIEQLRRELEDKDYEIKRLSVNLDEMMSLFYWMRDHIKEEYKERYIETEIATFKRINEWEDENKPKR